MSVPFQPSPPMTYAEEREAIHRAQGGGVSAMEALIRAQARYVMGEALKMASATVSADDLFQVGSAALVQSVRTFDLSREGVRLIVWAKPRIREAMNEERAASTTAVAIPGRTLRRFEQARRATSTMDEAADFAHGHGMDRRTFYAVAEALNGFRSLDETVASVNDAPGHLRDAKRSFGYARERDLAEVASVAPAPEPTAISRALAASILHAAGLDDRARQVIGLAYGFAGDPLTDAEIGQALGLSRQTVGRIRNTALAALQAAALSA